MGRRRKSSLTAKKQKAKKSTTPAPTGKGTRVILRLPGQPNLVAEGDDSNSEEGDESEEEGQAEEDAEENSQTQQLNKAVSKRKRSNTEATEQDEHSSPAPDSDIETAENQQSSEASSGDEVDEEDDEDLSDNDEAEEEEEGIAVPFLVPSGGAMVSLEILSTETWAGFGLELKDETGIDPTWNKIAFRFSTKAKGDPWIHLRSEKDYAAMMTQAIGTLTNHAKSRSKKTFAVELKVLDPIPEAGSAKKDQGSGKKKGKGKGKAPPKKRKTGDSSSDSGESDGALDGQKIRKSKKSAPQWIIDLQKDLACQDHDSKPCVKFGDVHVLLSPSDLATWSVFLANGYNSTFVPPKAMKLEDRANVKTAAKRSAPVPATTSPSTPTPAHGVPTGMYPMGFNPMMHPFYPMMPGQYNPPTPVPPPRYYQSQVSGSSSHHHAFEMPSSDPMEELDDITLFPRITDWLTELDRGPLGADGYDFAQYSDFFATEKYVRICDLADSHFTPASLSSACFGMPQGTADKLLNLCKKETTRIRKRAKAGLVQYR